VKKNRFRLGLVTALTACAMAAAGCGNGEAVDAGAGGDSTAGNGASGEQINFFAPTDVIGWSIYLADKKDYFAQGGANVKVTTFTSGSEAAEAFKAQNGMLLEAGDLPTIRFVNKPGTTVLATLVSYVGLNFVVSKDIKTAADLAGKKIAVNKGSSTEFWLDKYLKENGLDKKVEIKYLDPGSQPPALIKGDVDGAAMFMPQAVATLKSSDFHSLELWPSALMLVVDDAFLAKNKADVIKVIQALDKAAGDIESAPKDALKAVSGQYGLTDAQYDMLVDVGKASFHPQFTKSSYDLTQEQMAWLKARGEIDDNFDFCAAYDFSVLKEALPNAEVDETCAK
jgi:ABC-type nitrate/sulfonate/bicarbonate transport system substrate-binding protein